MKRIGLASFLLFALVLPNSGAWAQIEEIVVTAQRKEQSLQDVPVAVTALGAGQVENLQIETLLDLGESVPNLQTYEVTASAAAMQVHMRGASLQNPGFNTSESPVGLYLDDVYQGRFAAANLDLNDIERIEVLRGPQATLYGRNTIAGAVKFITRTPGPDDKWATGVLGYGNYETSKVAFSSGGELTDGWAASVSASFHDRGGGYISNPNDTELGEHTNIAGRAKFHYYSSENLNSVLTFWGVDVENDGYNGIPYAPFSNAVSASGEAPVPGRPINGNFYENLSSAPAFGDTKQAGLTLDWSYDFSGAVLRSITAVVSVEDDFQFDLAGGGFVAFSGASPTGGTIITSSAENEQLSQELQLLGTTPGGGLDWIVGFYYMSESGDQDYRGRIPNFLDFQELSQTDTDSYALFAEGTLKLGERWNLTAGLRWTEDQKEFEISCSGMSCTFDDPANPAPQKLDRSFGEITPKIAAQFQLNDDNMLYVSASNGFQAGGFQTLCFGNVSSSCAGAFYDPQTVWSYEIGYKGDMFDSRLRINALIFHAAYDDIQQTVIRGGAFPTQNVGEVDVTGAELEVFWSPGGGVNVFASFGFMESDYGSLNVGAIALRDGDLPSLPELTAKLGADWTFAISSGLDMSIGGAVYYSDEYFTEFTNALPIDSYTRLNGFVRLGDRDGRWVVSLNGRNLTDEEDNVSGIYQDGFTNIRTALPPREYMLTFTFNY